VKYEFTQITQLPLLYLLQKNVQQYNSRRIFSFVATNDYFLSLHLSDVTKMEVHYSRKTGYFIRLCYLTQTSVAAYLWRNVELNLRKVLPVRT